MNIILNERKLMKYKIVNQNCNTVIRTVETEKEGTQFILGIKDTTNNLIVVPECYQWGYSFRNNGYRWMPIPYTAIDNL